jgi:hypothetical protein
MSKKNTLFYCEVLCFCLLAFNAAGQKTLASWPATHWAHSSRNCHHLLSAPAQCNWDFFDIKGSLQGTIICWEQAQKNERDQNAASVAILKTSKETVRVLLPGNYATFQKGAHIKIAPAKEPDADLAVPLDRDFYLSEEKRGAKPVFRINIYDNSILKTTWGKVVN